MQTETLLVAHFLSSGRPGSLTGTLRKNMTGESIPRAYSITKWGAPVSHLSLPPSLYLFYSHSVGSGASASAGAAFMYSQFITLFIAHIRITIT